MNIVLQIYFVKTLQISLNDYNGKMMTNINDGDNICIIPLE